MMLCTATNDAVGLVPNVAVSISGVSSIEQEKELKSLRTDSQLRAKSVARVYVIGPEVFAWLELSMVGEVEHVLVRREDSNVLRVLTVINDRDPAVRAKIYPREQAIMDAWPNLKFDFHILARMNRPLEEVVGKVGRRIFKR